MTNQEDRYDSWVTIGSAAGTEQYNEVIRKAVTAVAEVPTATGNTNELLILFFQNRLTSTNGDLDELKQEFAEGEGANSWDELGAFS